MDKFDNVGGQEMPSANTSRKQQNKTAILGAFILLTIIMVFTTTISHFFNKTPSTNKISNVEADKFQAYIVPLVILDIKPFESVAKASQDDLLLSAIWSVLLSREASKYQTQSADDNRIIVPQIDVENAYMNFFGVLPKHKNLVYANQDFEYVNAEKCYYIPVFGIDNTFSPHIVGSTQKDNTLSLTVEYIPYSNWQQDETGSVIPAKANKKMIYNIEINKNKYKILSVRKG